MQTSLLVRVAPAFATLLDEPGEGWPEVADGIRAALAGEAPSAADAVGRFVDAIASEPLETLRELHARTFDLMPVCAPYLSVHVFGEESFKRSRLMGGLADGYRAAGFDTGGELPDHLALVLRFMPSMTTEEQDDLVQYVLTPAIDRMAREFARGANPYRYLIEAILATLTRLARPEAVDA
jgi:nitrate reductase delta subunit